MTISSFITFAFTPILLLLSGFLHFLKLKIGEGWFASQASQVVAHTVYKLAVCPNNMNLYKIVNINTTGSCVAILQ